MLITTAKVALQKSNCDDAQINICLVKDPTIKKLNKTYRGKNYATDVLSFEVPKGFPGKAKSCCVGDVIISVETAARNAKEDGKSLNSELMELLVHGILHLCGYDHGDKMLRLQKAAIKEALGPKWKA